MNIKEMIYTNDQAAITFLVILIIQGIFANQTYEEAINELGFTYLTKKRGRQE